MRRLRLLAVILFVFGLALITILFYEEFTNNLNYYYNHMTNVVLLILVGALLLIIGSRLMFWERKTKEAKMTIKLEWRLLAQAF